MPCQSDFPQCNCADDTRRLGMKLELERISYCMAYLYEKIGREMPDWLSDPYQHNTTCLDEATAMLCEACRSLTPEEVQSIIYNPDNSTAKRLAAWWERHQEWDARRVREDLTATIATMSELGFEPLGPIGGGPGFGIVFFFDPDGIKVQLSGPRSE